jgi:hypothetical protein
MDVPFPFGYSLRLPVSLFSTVRFVMGVFVNTGTRNCKLL